MKYIFSTLLFLFPLLVSAEVYRCKQPDGTFSFSDKSCSEGAIKDKVTLKSKSIDWVSQLRSEKPSSIHIIEVIQKNGDVTIKYEFKTMSASNEFVKLTNHVSNMPVMLMKYIEPKKGGLGRSEIKVSNKPNPLIDKLKRANK